MNILNKLFLATTVMSTFFMVSCSDSSEDLTPSEPESNPFQVDPSRTDEEALICRDFYDKTGIYLLFTDTLIHRTELLRWLISTGITAVIRQMITGFPIFRIFGKSRLPQTWYVAILSPT